MTAPLIGHCAVRATEWSEPSLLVAASGRWLTVSMQAGAYPFGFPVAVIVRWAFDRTLEVEFNETDSILSFLD